jgi:hypothetical protein
MAQVLPIFVRNFYMSRFFGLNFLLLNSTQNRLNYKQIEMCHFRQIFGIFRSRVFRENSQVLPIEEQILFELRLWLLSRTVIE